MNSRVSILISAALIASAFFSTKGYSQQSTDCDFWGETATMVAINYDNIIRIGRTPEEALAETKDLFGYDYNMNKGGMSAAYYGAVFEALAKGKRGIALHQLGANICLSYPAGTFDPDGFG